jgi:hypothetical protein
VSSRKCPDVKDLKRIIRHLGVEMRSSQPIVQKQEFLLALHERYGDQLTPEQFGYALGEYAWPVARKAMQDIEAADEGLFEDRQMVLPIRLAHVKVPKALPIVMDGVPQTVTSVYAGIPEGDAYTVSLQGNSQACINKLIDWLSVWEPARKVMVENPGFDFGDATAFLADQEGPDTVPLPPIDED